MTFLLPPGIKGLTHTKEILFVFNEAYLLGVLGFILLKYLGDILFIILEKAHKFLYQRLSSMILNLAQNKFSL